METISSNIENGEIESLDRWSFDQKKFEQQVEEIQRDKDEDRKQRESELRGKMHKLNEDTDKKERVSEFIRDNCSEPINWVEEVVPFEKLVKLLFEDAQNEVNKCSEEIKESFLLWKVRPWIRKREKQQVLDSIKKGNAKDKRIYELPAYKDLIEKWFILP